MESGSNKLLKLFSSVLIWRLHKVLCVFVCAYIIVWGGGALCESGHCAHMGQRVVTVSNSSGCPWRWGWERVGSLCQLTHTQTHTTDLINERVCIFVRSDHWSGMVLGLSWWLGEVGGWGMGFSCGLFCLRCIYVTVQTLALASPMLMLQTVSKLLALFCSWTTPPLKVIHPSHVGTKLLASLYHYVLLRRVSIRWAAAAGGFTEQVSDESIRTTWMWAGSDSADLRSQHGS